jgi:tetratricopeptide (TPR) repeat protein
MYDAWAYAKGGANRKEIDEALADARKAITLAPELSEGHLAMSSYFDDGALNFAQASAELEHAVALAPGSALAIGSYGVFAVLTGRTDASVAAAHHAVALDPLNPESHFRLEQALYFARRYTESVAAFSDVLTLDPHDTDSPGLRGLAYYSLGDFEKRAHRAKQVPTTMSANGVWRSPITNSDALPMQKRPWPNCGPPPMIVGHTVAQRSTRNGETCLRPCTNWTPRCACASRSSSR